jgi:hypothetical protein
MPVIRPESRIVPEESYENRRQLFGRNRQIDSRALDRKPSLETGLENKLALRTYAARRRTSSLAEPCSGSGSLPDRSACNLNDWNSHFPARVLVIQAAVAAIEE